MNLPSLRLPLHFDTALLQADLARVPPQAWLIHFNQRIYEGDWSGVPLRAVPGSAIPIYSDPNAQTWEDTPLLQSCDYFRQVLASFHCPLLSVRLLRLGPGAIIKEHRDPMLGLDYGEVRIHVVVSTNPGVECGIDGIGQHWAAGECWYADFSLPHSFANRGETERVHMVLDCVLNDWLHRLLEESKAFSQACPPPNFPIINAPNMADDPFQTLRQSVHNDPGLQELLFGLTDTADFIAVVQQLAQSLDHELEAEAVRHAMRTGRKAWVERNLPR